MASAREPTVGDQLPFDFPVLWRATLFDVENVKVSWVAFLLSDRRQDANLAISDLENGIVRIAVAVSTVDAMQRFGRDLLHLVGDRVIAVGSRPVDAGPDQEMRSGFSGRAEKLVDVALAITNVDASCRVIESVSANACPRNRYRSKLLAEAALPSAAPARHDLTIRCGADAGTEPSPLGYQRAALVEQVAAPIGSFDLVLDRMCKRHLDRVARG